MSGTLWVWWGRMFVGDVEMPRGRANEGKVVRNDWGIKVEEFFKL